MTLLTKCRKPTEACFTFYPNENISLQTSILFDASCSMNASCYNWGFGDGTTENSIRGKTTTEHKYYTPISKKTWCYAKKG
jgi:hypothetical protein